MEKIVETIGRFIGNTVGEGDRNRRDLDFYNYTIKDSCSKCCDLALYFCAFVLFFCKIASLFVNNSNRSNNNNRGNNNNRDNNRFHNNNRRNNNR